MKTGTLIRRYQLAADLNGVVVSPDTRWAATFSGARNNSLGRVTVLDLADGTVRAEHADWQVNAFFPDGLTVVVTDYRNNRVKVVDWRTSREIWGQPGYATVWAISDSDLNRVLIDAATDSPIDRSHTSHYWIVGGNGEASVFQPAT